MFNPEYTVPKSNNSWTVNYRPNIADKEACKKFISEMAIELQALSEIHDFEIHLTNKEFSLKDKE